MPGPQDRDLAQTAEQLGKWLPPEPGDSKAPQVDFDGEQPEIDFGDEDEAGEAKKPKKKIKTRVRKGKKSKSRKGEDGPISHRIRLVAPTTEAIEQFTTIVNSGCLGGG